MRPVIVIALQKSFDLLLEQWHLAWFVFAPSQAFLPQSAVKAFDVSLLILLVRPRDTVTVTKQAGAQSKLALKLWAAIILQ